MKAESKLMAVLLAFSWVMAIIYGVFSHWKEPVGVVGLILTGGLAAMIGFFLWRTGSKIDLRPDDDPEGEIADIEGDYGFFSPHSWWPLILAAAGALMFLGMAVGWWLVIISTPFLILAVIGWTFEYFRGEDAI